MYLDAIKVFPKGDTRLRTKKGTANHIKTDVFKQQMWYAYEGEAGISGGLVPLSPDRVREILRMNKDGKKPEDLSEGIVFDEKEPDYTNVVGQDSLNRFEHIFKKKKKKRKSGGNKRGGNNNQNRPKQAEAKKQSTGGEGGKPKTKGRNKRRRPNKNRNNEGNK